MAVRYDGRLAGIMRSTFRMGTTTRVMIKESSGTLQIRDGTDANHADLTAKSIKIHGTNSSFGVTLAVPAGLAGNVTLTLPDNDGASGEVLTTDGAGSLYWAAASAGAIRLEEQAFTQASSSPITFFTPSAGAKLLRFRVVVTANASGGSPTLSIGVTGTVAAYMTTAENDLKIAGEYIVDEVYDVGGSPTAVIITIVVSGQTFTGIVYCEWSS